MSVRRPHYLLHSQAEPTGSSRGWSFRLQAVDGKSPICANEREQEASPERLELLAVVRGLEAVPEPARVTLLTASDVVQRGIRFGLEEWRADDWHWESFGERVPVRHLDLWRRIDRALSYHQLDVRRFRVDPAHELAHNIANNPVEHIEQSHDRTFDSHRENSRPVAHENSTTLTGPHIRRRATSVAVSCESELTAARSESVVLERPVLKQRSHAQSAQWFTLTEAELEFVPLDAPAEPCEAKKYVVQISSSRFWRAPRRQLRVWRLHLIRRLGELRDSLRWFADTTGVSQCRLPWHETPQIRSFDRFEFKTRFDRR